MELIKFSQKVYEYFAYRIYGKNMDWRQVYGKKGVEAAEKFANTMLERYGAAAGPSFVWFYIVFQFGRFELSNFKPEAYVKFITPAMIFGDGAMEKFGDRKSIDELTIKSSWLQRFQLSQQEFVKLHKFTFTTTMKKVDISSVDKKLRQYVDPIKRVTATTGQGIDLCLDLTDLYNHKDPSCQVCPYVKECKEKLKENNPRIFKLRRYE